jgi:hypothetical protein
MIKRNIDVYILPEVICYRTTPLHVRIKMMYPPILMCLFLFGPVKGSVVDL